MEFAAIFVFVLATAFLSGSESAKFTIVNKCPYTVWPATLTGSGTPVAATGFELPSGTQGSIDIPPPWSGRIWGRTGCSTSSGKFSCATADCGTGQATCNGQGGTPPSSLIEFTLATGSGLDFYDVSLVDGFNLPLSVAPQGGSGACAQTSCSANVNAVCPNDLAVKGSDGSVIACKSACFAFNTPEYCCSGALASPDKCGPSDYSKIFKTQCPQAYSYAFDDKTSTFTCGGGANYVVTFCP